MLSVKNAIFFLDLSSLKKRLEIRFNNILDRKETFCDYKENVLTSQKWQFSKVVNQCFWSKIAMFFII